MRHLIVISMLLLLSPAFAEDAPPPPCSDPAHRQFDFWIGSWEVHDADGKRQGSNVVSRVAGQCGLREDWTGADGTSGTSLNYYDPQDQLWHQDWVGQSGLILHLAGAREGRAMVMSGLREGPRGRAQDRITWRPLDDGRVEQTWEVSTDEGETWRVVFRGFYSRAD